MTAEPKKQLEISIDNNHAGKRLDKCLSELVPEYSRSHLQNLIKEKFAKLNGNICTAPRTILKSGDRILLNFPEETSFELKAENIELPLLYEDDDVIVINKPPGKVVHPGAGNLTGTIVNALIGRDPDFQSRHEPDDVRPGIVHRLDKDTSGCLIIAKNSQAHCNLAKEFAERSVKKTYAAIVYGWPENEEARIETLIGRHPVNRKKMAVVSKNGKEAVTIYKILKKGKINSVPLSLLEIKILTGRTHQIRTHMAYIKHPVLGDTVYGGKQKIEVSRQMLHAWKIRLPHPADKRMLKFKAPWPEDFKQLADSIT